jgi:MscS family membrane protein
MRASSIFFALRRWWLACLFASFAASVAHAQEAGETDKQKDKEAVEIDERSPRATVGAFLHAVHKGRFDEAAVYLELPKRNPTANPVVLAAHVQAVLARKLWIDVESLSGAAEGNLADGLAPRLEQIGVIKLSNDHELPIRLARARASDPVGWRLSRTTVAELDLLYMALPDRWALENAPAWLQEVGPGDLMWWQWLGVLGVLVLAAGFGRVLSWITRRLLSRITLHTRTGWDDALVTRARGPLALFWTVVLSYLALPYLVLPPHAHAHALTFVKTGLIVALFWSALRSIDLTTDVLAGSPALHGKTAGALLPVMSRITKVAVFAMLVIAVLSSFGLPVASLLAGLGVGGIALALAAQKTVENVFGAISIGADVPFHVGDTIKVDDLIGTVEALGLRSTRLRTLDRTLVTIPNGKLADARIESLTARDRLRMGAKLSLEYGTSSQQIRAILTQLEEALRKHPRIWAETIVVRFTALAASSLDIEINAWFVTRDWNEFQTFRQDMLLEFMAIIEQNRASFAFPSQTLYVKPQSPVASA